MAAPPAKNKPGMANGRIARRARNINAALTPLPHAGRMVIRTRSRTVLTALGLYVLVGLLIAYFGMHAQSGRRGIKATEDLAIEMNALTAELTRLKTERTEWERRVALMRAESLDPDMLDEHARAMLDYVHPRDLVLTSNRRAAEPKLGPVAAAR